MAVPSKVRSRAEVKEAVGSPRKRICWRRESMIVWGLGMIEGKGEWMGWEERV